LLVVHWSPRTFLVDSGSAYSMALLATIAVEGLLALVYAAVRGKRVSRWLTNVLLVNLITHPVLWFVMARQSGDLSYLSILAVAEAGVWLVEAALLYLLGGGQLGFREALLLSLVLNGVSAGVGLVLPV
jgi:hypothetical protein